MLNNKTIKVPEKNIKEYFYILGKREDFSKHDMRSILTLKNM